MFIVVDAIRYATLMFHVTPYTHLLLHYIDAYISTPQENIILWQLGFICLLHIMNQFIMGFCKCRHNLLQSDYKTNEHIFLTHVSYNTSIGPPGELIFHDTLVPYGLLIKRLFGYILPSIRFVFSYTWDIFISTHWFISDRYYLPIWYWQVLPFPDVE